MKLAASGSVVILLLALLLACGEPNQRLDEYGFYDGPQIRLKVVRYYRNIPFNYLGEHAVVMCKSNNTAEFSVNDRQDAGWRVLGPGTSQGSKSAREAALSVQDDYEVLDDSILIAKTSVFNISFDACGHFISWDPSRLPTAMIDPIKKPDSCAPNGPTDCRYYDFEGDRAPRYEQIRVAGIGQVGFTTTSKTFKDVESLRVQTKNNGAVWHVDTLERHAEEQRLEPDTLRSLSVASLDKGMQDVSLVDWLESTLPPRSMVIWPNLLTTCGQRHRADGESSPAPCAEIRFKDFNGNNGTLYIDMNTDYANARLKASFHSGVYVSGDRSRFFKSLTELREILDARRE